MYTNLKQYWLVQAKHLCCAVIVAVVSCSNTAQTESNELLRRNKSWRSHECLKTHLANVHHYSYARLSVHTIAHNDVEIQLADTYPSRTPRKFQSKANTNAKIQTPPGYTFPMFLKAYDLRVMIC